MFSFCVKSCQGHRFRSQARRARQTSVTVKINKDDTCEIADGDHHIEAGGVQILGSLKMVAHLINSSGECNTCKDKVKESDILKCYDCKSTYHVICGEVTPFGNKTFVGTFKKLKVDNYLFVCDICLTQRENNEASTLKDQIEALTAKVDTLVSDFQEIKNEKTQLGRSDLPEKGKWSDKTSVKRMTSSLCIKSNGAEVNLAKMQELAKTNSIQVTKTTIKENGDVYVDLPSEENRVKLAPLLNDQAFATNSVIELKTKLPTISILDVKEFSTKESFVEKVKQQNPVIKELIEGGSEFSIVYSKNIGDSPDRSSNKHYQVIARVGVDIRKAIKANRDRIFADLTSYRIVDRFYIKRCNNCQQFGHYEKDCKNPVCCGFCCSTDHKSKDCPKVNNESKEHKCINCQRKEKDGNGHSAMWYKCPTYVEMQSKLKKTIPYYQKN